MKSKNKLMELQLEATQIAIALDSRCDLAQSMQDQLLRREVLLRETLEEITGELVEAAQETVH